jgi:glycosyltransferase involved in cell wall biosynthesis
VHDPHLDALVAHDNPREKFRVVINVPDPNIFTPREDPAPERDTFTLGYHGTIAPRHGLEVALRAVAKARERVPSIRFLIVGDGDDRPRIERLIAELGLDDVVTLRPGFVPLDDLVPLVRDVDLGIVPIYYDSFTRYMLPVKLLEYVSLNVPTASSDTETIRAYFDDSMVAFFPAGDADALAELLVELPAAPARRRALARNAYSFVDAHAWSREKTIYHRLADGLTGRLESRVEQGEAAA